jgi:hypothetical protein
VIVALLVQQSGWYLAREKTDPNFAARARALCDTVAWNPNELSKGLKLNARPFFDQLGMHVNG